MTKKFIIREHSRDFTSKPVDAAHFAEWDDVDSNDLSIQEFVAEAEQGDWWESDNGLISVRCIDSTITLTKHELQDLHAMLAELCECQRKIGATDENLTDVHESMRLLKKLIAESV